MQKLKKKVMFDSIFYDIYKFEVDSDDPWSKPIAKQVIKNQTPPVQSSTIKPQTNAINIASKTTR